MTDPLRCQFSHHRCASSWTNNIMRDICRLLGLRFAVVHTTDGLGENPARFIREHRVQFLVLSNADISVLNQLPPFKAFHVIRDPRDVVVSSYFSHRYSHPLDEWPELGTHRKDLASMTIPEGHHYEITNCRAKQFADMMAWDYDRADIMEWQMEDLVSDPLNGFRQILDHLEIPVACRIGLKDNLSAVANRLYAFGWHGYHGHRSGPIREPGSPFNRNTLSDRHLRRILHRHQFRKKSGGREPGQVNVSNHYRSGKAGDWEQHLDATHLAAMRHQYPELIRRLGYD